MLNKVATLVFCGVILPVLCVDLLLFVDLSYSLVHAAVLINTPCQLLATTLVCGTQACSVPN